MTLYVREASVTSSQSCCNGQIGITTSAVEMRMSHWVHSPVVTDLVSREVLLDLSDSLWDLMSINASRSSVDLSLRKYPGSGPPVLVRVSSKPKGFQFSGRAVGASGIMALLHAHV